MDGGSPGPWLFTLAVTVLFVAPLAYVGEGLVWWTSDPAANPLAWDEAMLEPGSPEYDAWVASHNDSLTRYCSSWGSDPNASFSGGCCPREGQGSAVSAGSGWACGSAWSFQSEGSGAGGGSGVGSAGGAGGGSGVEADGGGSGGGGGPDVGGGAGGAGGADAPGPGVLAAVLALAVLARVWRRSR